MNNTLIPHTKKQFDFINKVMDKGALKDLLAQIYLEFGGAKAADLANNLKNLGYKYATKSRFSLRSKHRSTGSKPSVCTKPNSP